MQNFAFKLFKNTGLCFEYQNKKKNKTLSFNI